MAIGLYFSSHFAFSLEPLDAWICILVAIDLVFGLFEGVGLNRKLVLPIYHIDLI